MKVKGPEIKSFIDDVRAAVAAEEYHFDKCATRAEPEGPYHKQDVIAAILQTNGTYGDMGVLLSRKRSSVKSYVEANWDVLEFLNELTETRLDQLERKSMDMALAGDGAQVRFILKTLGKDRGYTTRTEMTGADGKPLEVQSMQFDLASLTDEELAAYKLLAERNEGAPTGSNSGGGEQTEV